MTTEIEKTFFDTFGIGKPKLKVWRYSGYYEDYSWDSELIDCAELLERNNWTIEELNERIQTSKQEEKEKNSELYDYRFDSVETEFGKTTKAFVDYPQLTDRILLELISICVLYGWHLCRYWNGDQNFVYENQRLKPEERFCVINPDLKNATLILLIELVNKEDFKHQVRTLFEEG